MKKPVGIFAETMSRCREIAKENGLTPILEGVGDCVFITDAHHMKSYEFSRFIVDPGFILSDEMKILIRQFSYDANRVFSVHDNSVSKPTAPVMCTISVTEDDMKALIRIRNYFGENDKTQLEYLACDVLDRVVKNHKYLLEKSERIVDASLRMPDESMSHFCDRVHRDKLGSELKKTD